MTPPSNPPTTPPISTTPTPTPPATNTQDNTKAIITLVLGILSLVCCYFFTGIPAIFLGRSELRAIDEGRSPESNRNLTKVGYILGIIGTILGFLGLIVYAVIIILAVVAGKASGPSTF